MSGAPTAYEYYKDKRVVVTGGSGFIGKHLTQALWKAGATVRIFDLKQGEYQEIRNSMWLKLGFHFTIPGDLAESKPPDIIFHLAAQTEVDQSYEEPDLAYSTNVLGTLNVLEAARTMNPQPRIIVASTDKVYGPALDPPEEGTTFHDTPSPYGQSKQMADTLSRDYQRFYKLPVRIVRSVNTYGPGQLNETTLITGSVMRILRGGIPLLHERNCKREWMYIDDAISAYMLLGAHDIKSRAGEVFNVGTGQVLRSGEVITAIMKELETPDGLAVEQRTEFSPIRDYDQTLDSTKFRTWFDWNPLPFSEGLKRTVAWYKQEFTGGRIK